MAASSTTYPIQEFIEVSTEFRQLSMGSNRQVWALGTNYALYKRQLQPTGQWKWVRMPDLPIGSSARHVSCAADGTTLVTDNNNKVFLYTALTFVPATGGPASNWAELQNVRWRGAATGSSRGMVGVSFDENSRKGTPQLYLGNGVFNDFGDALFGLEELHMAADNTIMGLTKPPAPTTAVYRFSAAGLTPAQRITTDHVVAVALGVGGADQVLVADAHNNLYRYLGEQTFAGMAARVRNLEDSTAPPQALNGTICNIACCGESFYFVVAKNGDTYTTYAAFNE